MKMSITTKDWEDAIHHFNVVKSRYTSLFGQPGVAVGPALALTFNPLEQRYNSGERTEELYKELLNVE
jgi:hypothetical protein